MNQDTLCIVAQYIGVPFLRIMYQVCKQWHTMVNEHFRKEFLTPLLQVPRPSVKKPKAKKGYISWYEFDEEPNTQKFSDVLRSYRDFAKMASTWTIPELGTWYKYAQSKNIEISAGGVQCLLHRICAKDETLLVQHVIAQYISKKQDLRPLQKYPSVAKYMQYNAASILSNTQSSLHVAFLAQYLNTADLICNFSKHWTLGFYRYSSLATRELSNKLEPNLKYSEKEILESQAVLCSILLNRQAKLCCTEHYYLLENLPKALLISLAPILNVEQQVKLLTIERKQQNKEKNKMKQHYYGKGKK